MNIIDTIMINVVLNFENYKKFKTKGLKQKSSSNGYFTIVPK